MTGGKGELYALHKAAESFVLNVGQADSCPISLG